jgi:threonine/homoserine/homoserine lactone efflux protein
VADETAHSGSGDVRIGVVLGIGLNVLYTVLWIAMMFHLPKMLFFSIFFIGATQLLYIGPAIWYYRRKQRPGVVKGLIIAAAVTALLNGMCWAKLKS